jgi:hypothetical protein
MIAAEWVVTKKGQRNGKVQEEESLQRRRKN